jgi:hypothetical protein
LVFSHIVEFLYTGTVKIWHTQVLIETILVADQFLLPSLKMQAANVLAKEIGK